MARLLQPIEIAKLFLIIRDQCCDADNRHPMAKHFTVEDIERYEQYLENYSENKRKEKEYKKNFLGSNI